MQTEKRRLKTKAGALKLSKTGSGENRRNSKGIKEGQSGSKEENPGSKISEKRCVKRA